MTSHPPVARVAFSDVFGRVRTLMTGAGLGQVIQLASLTLLSRLYGAADFGNLGRVQSIGTLLAVVVSMQLHLSIPMSTNDTELRERVSALESLAIAWLLMSVALALIFGSVVGAGAVLAVALSVANTYSSTLVYRGRFGALARFSVGRALVIAGLQLTFALLDIAHGLIIGALVGELGWAAVLRAAAVGARHPLRVAARSTLQTLGRLRAFSLYGTVQELVAVAAFYAPVLLYARFYDAATGGQYVMSSRLVWAPVILVSGSIAKVLYHELGQRPPKTSAAFRALLPGPLVVVGLAGIAVLPFFLAPLYALILGGGWALAGTFIPWQVLWGLAFLLSLPARIACRVSELQWIQLIVDAAALLAIAALFLLDVASPVDTMRGLVAISVVQNAGLTLAMLAHFRRRDAAGAA